MSEAFALLLFIGEIFSFIFGASLWPRVQALTAQAPVATGTIIETGTAGARESSVDSEKRLPPVEAGASVGSRVEPANPAVVGTRAAPSVAGHRRAPVQEHVELVVTVLRELGLTEVPAFVVHEFYWGFMQGKGIQPLPINHFCQMLAMVCARFRKRYDRDGTGKKPKVTFYRVPLKGTKPATIEQANKPEPETVARPGMTVPGFHRVDPRVASASEGAMRPVPLGSCPDLRATAIPSRWA